MTKPLQQIIGETCASCRGACCADKIDDLTDGWLGLTRELIFNPGYALTLSARLQKEMADVYGYEASPENKESRKKALSWFSQFLQSYYESTQGVAPEISRLLVSKISDAALRFSHAQNRRENPFPRRDYCGFNTPKGCMIPEGKAAICRDFFCDSCVDYRGISNSENLMKAILNGGYGVKDYLDRITVRQTEADVLKSIMIHVALQGYNWQPQYVVFNGSGIMDGLCEIAGGREKMGVAANPDRAHFERGINIAVIHPDFSISDRKGANNVMDSIYKLGYLQSSPIGPVYRGLVGNDRSIRLTVLDEGLEELYNLDRKYFNPRIISTPQFIECV
jgi:hypothetical protein